ncbi:MAG: hypothetical protein ACOC9Q_00805 [bacterium]
MTRRPLTQLQVDLIERARNRDHGRGAITATAEPEPAPAPKGQLDMEHLDIAGIWAKWNTPRRPVQQGK